MPPYALVDIQSFRLLLFNPKIIYSHNDLFPGLNSALELVRSFRDLLLGVPCLNRFHHATQGIDASEIIEGAFSICRGERFDIIRSAERINLSAPRRILRQ